MNTSYIEGRLAAQRAFLVALSQSHRERTALVDEPDDLDLLMRSVTGPVRFKLEKAGIDIDEFTHGFIDEQEFFKDTLTRALQYLYLLDDQPQLGG